MRLTDIPAAAPALAGSETCLGLQAGAAALLPFRASPTQGRRVLQFGTSITAFNSYSAGTHFGTGDNGIFAQLQRLWGQRLFHDPALNKGVAGDTTVQMQARFADDVLANLPSFDILWMEGGGNDCKAGYAAAQTAANLIAMAEAILRTGRTVILMTLLPRSGWAGAALGNAQCNLLLKQVNQRLRSWAETVSLAGRLFLVDPTRDVVDPASASGAVAAGLFGDGLHPNGAGAQVIANRFAQELSPHFPRLPTRLSDASDTFDAAYNPLGNILPNPGLLTATGGGPLTNVGGVTPAGWGVQRTSGGFNASEVVMSVEAQAAGVDATPGNRMVATVAIAAGRSASETFEVNAGYLDVGAAYAPGDRLFGEVEIDVVSPVNLVGLQLNVIDYDGATQRFWTDGMPNYGWTYWNQSQAGLLLRTPTYTAAPAAGDRLYRFGVIAVFDASASAASAVLKIGAPQLRRAV